MAIVINGSGTVTGLAVGGLPDDTVDAGTLANSINTEITANTAKTGITSSQATAITAALPKAGGTMTGTIAGFTSTGIDDNADATSITIDANENVGLRVIPKNWPTIYTTLQVGSNLALTGRTNEDSVFLTNNAYNDSVDNRWEYLGANGTSEACMINMGNDGEMMVRTAPSGAANAAITWTTRFHVTNDGRGLSQFTAKAWARFSSTALTDSHNCSSFVDNGTGDYTINFSNHMTNASYCPVMSSHSNMFIGTQTNPAVGGIRMGNFNDHGNREDGDYFGLAIFGD